jgi:hypothetical protein
MTHYMRREWINYVRQTVTEEQRASMAQHLATGCGSCAQDVVASTEITFSLVSDESPNDGQSDQDAAAYWGAIAATIYDSFVDESAAGTRGLGDTARYLLFQVGPLQIDVCLKRKDRAALATLTGQIADTRHADAQFPGAVVRVMNGGALLAETRTNQFGEFTVDYDPQISPKICLRIAQQREVAIQIAKV